MTEQKRSWIDGKALRVTMPDGSMWDVPLRVIAMSRARYYAIDYDGDEERALREEVEPLFMGDDAEISDWARNSMDWSDVEAHARMVSGPTEPNYQEGWVNGDHDLVEAEKST